MLEDEIEGLVTQQQGVKRVQTYQKPAQYIRHNNPF